MPPVRAVVILLLLAPLWLATPAHAATWGLGDSDPATLSTPLFQDLRLRHVRLVTPWDAVWTQPAKLDAWLSAARVQRLVPLVAFNHSTDDLCAKPCRAPTLLQYRRAIREFRHRYPWVRELTPWNEGNQGKQPTAHNPELAARYYGIVRQECPGCTVVAADLLDTRNMVGWFRRFLAVARPRPQLIGLHDYSDVNHFRSFATDALLRMTRARVWLTETGGVVALRVTAGARPFQEQKAALALNYLFDLVARRPRIGRVYLYQWRRTNSFDMFDAGLLAADQTPRPGYFVVRRRLAALRAHSAASRGGWSRPTVVARHANSPSVAIDSAGRVVSAWVACDRVDLSSHIVGAVGSVRVLGRVTALSDVGGWGIRPRVGWRNPGDALVAWGESDSSALGECGNLGRTYNAESSIAAGEWVAGDYRQLGPVVAPGDSSRLSDPELVSDGLGGAVVAWTKEGADDKGRALRQVDASLAAPGGSFGPPTMIADNPSSLAGVVAGGGRTVAAVVRGTDSVTFEEIGSAGASRPIAEFPITRGQPASFALAISRGGDVVAAWNEVPQDEGDERIVVTTCPRGGACSPRTVVEKRRWSYWSRVLDLKLAVNASGDVLLTWNRYGSIARPTIQPVVEVAYKRAGKPFGAARVIFKGTLDSANEAGSLSPVWADANHALVAWREASDENRDLQRVRVASSVNGRFGRVKTLGPAFRWDYFSDQSAVALASDGRGHVVAMWDTPQPQVFRAVWTAPKSAR